MYAWLYLLTLSVIQLATAKKWDVVDSVQLVCILINTSLTLNVKAPSEVTIQRDNNGLLSPSSCFKILHWAAGLCFIKLSEERFWYCKPCQSLPTLQLAESAFQVVVTSLSTLQSNMTSDLPPPPQKKTKKTTTPLWVMSGAMAAIHWPSGNNIWGCLKDTNQSKIGLPNQENYIQKLVNFVDNIHSHTCLHSSWGNPMPMIFFLFFF